MNIKCLVFDCDGVLLDSVPVKTRAFARLAEPYGEEARDRFVMYHAMHGGVSRTLKFAWFFREILNREITPEESARWGELFARYALEEVRQCEMIPGARETLEKWRGILPMFVCSGAPQEELRLVLEERGLSGFFKGIYGYPPTKDKILATIVKESLLPADEVLMIGDATTDRDAAEYADTRFYGIGDLLRGGEFPWSEDLRPFNSWLEKNMDKLP